METSFFLAQALGLYFLLVSIIFIFKRSMVRKAVARIHRNRLTVYVLAALELALGIFILVGHNIWSGWQVIITVIGVGLILEGLFYLVAPMRLIERLLKRFTKKSWYVIALVFTFILGAILALKGYQIW